MATPEEFAAAGLRTISNQHCTAAALDLGATITSWRPAGGEEVLFVSRDAAVGEGLEIHGGIPICAPWFGQGRDDVDVPGPHGLVRWVPWQLVSDSKDETGTRLVWELEGDAVAHLPGAEAYPVDAWLRLEAHFGRELTIRFTVGSPSTEFVLDEALHTYFRLPAGGGRILGLEGTQVRDYTQTPPAWRTSEGALEVPAVLNGIHRYAGEVRLETAEQTVVISSGKAADVVVWNPGPDVPADFAADEWEQMVCIEVGNVQGDAVTVLAGGSHTLVMTISVEARSATA
ncbi:D-hexose-6-phosphate mutarotase [Tessaracoccus terricola]